MHFSSIHVNYIRVSFFCVKKDVPLDIRVITYILKSWFNRHLFNQATWSFECQFIFVKLRQNCHFVFVILLILESLKLHFSALLRTVLRSWFLFTAYYLIAFKNWRARLSYNWNTCTVTYLCPKYFSIEVPLFIWSVNHVVKGTLMQIWKSPYMFRSI